MGKYFTETELIKSETAKRHKIDNTPSKDTRKHLQELIKVLDNLREFYGQPIIISSGYRCPTLNRMVGGVATSAHQYGYAADMLPADGDFDKFRKACASWAREADLDFDQLIIEKSKKTQWVHLGIKSPNGTCRRQVFTLDAS